jgi:hypothetical protein
MLAGMDAALVSFSHIIQAAMMAERNRLELLNKKVRAEE